MRAAASSLLKDERKAVQREGELCFGPLGIFHVRPQRVKWKKEDGWQKSDEKQMWSTLVVKEGGPEERVYEERWGEGDLSLVVSSAAWLESILSGPSRQGFNLELPRTNKWVFNHTRQAVDLLYPSNLDSLHLKLNTYQYLALAYSCVDAVTEYLQTSPLWIQSAKDDTKTNINCSCSDTSSSTLLINIPVRTSVTLSFCCLLLTYTLQA